MLNGMMGNALSAAGDLLGSLLRPMAQSFGEMAYYALIAKWVRAEINLFGFELMKNIVGIVGTSALILVTIWIFFQGLRIMTGQSRDSLMVLVMNSLKVTLIVFAAIAIGFTSTDVHRIVSEDLPSVITRAVTGEEDGTIEEQIDSNLAAMQFALTSIDAVNIVSDPTLNDDKKRAMMMTTVGTAGPAMIGGAMLLLYQVAMALFIGLGPLFVLCLMFDQTKSFFQRWLMYGISTMFSMAVLSAMIAIATKLVFAVAGAFWASTTLGALTGMSLQDGMTTVALQQGGVGLLMTVLIVTTPPMAANFFNGAIGSAAYYSAFQQGFAYKPGSMAGGGGGGYGGGYGGGRAQGGGRPGANPGEPGYRPPAYESSESLGNNASRPMQGGYNNPATNAYGGSAPASQTNQGRLGAATAQNTSPPTTPPRE